MADKSRSGRLGVDYTETYTDERFPLGLEDMADNNGCYVFARAVSSQTIAQYHCVAIDENHKAQSITTTLAADGHTVGFCQVALTADSYGWVALRGSGIKALCGASCAADATLYTSGTAGVLDDTSTNETRVNGVTNTAAIGDAASSVDIIATYPHTL